MFPKAFILLFILVFKKMKPLLRKLHHEDFDDIFFGVGVQKLGRARLGLLFGLIFREGWFPNLVNLAEAEGPNGGYRVLIQLTYTLNVEVF